MNKSFVDLQLNGYGGVDFNGKSINADELHAACELLDTHGVKAILATVITDDVDRMCGRLRQIVEIADADPLVKRIIAGLHVEGPFINENAGYRGAHPADQIKPANVSDAAKLVEAGNGMVKIFTLAPERDEGKKVTRFLAEKGIKVAAGHTNAPMRDLEEACDAGLTLFTHLGNGCPMNMHRHDNIIQRGISLAGRLKLGLVGDCVHVPMPALANYIKLAGIENCFVVTDGTAASGMGPGTYTLGDWEVLVGEDLVCMAPDGSHLVGSAVTMSRCSENLIKAGFTEPQARQLTFDNPMRILSGE